MVPSAGGDVMAWIRLIEEGEAETPAKEAFARVTRERGKLSNIMKVQGLNAAAMLKHLELYVTLMFGASPLSRAERELIGVVVSAANGCAYCLRHHRNALNFYWKDDERVAAAARDWRDAALSARERALAAYAEKLTRAPGEMAAQDVAALRAHGLADREILDADMITAYFNFANRIAAGLGVEFSEAEAEGYNDALMLDWRGRIAEATGANIFLVQMGELHTPTPDCFLDGITRRVVIGLSKKRGYKIVERPLMPEELAKTDEVFIPGTAVEVTPVREIGEYKFEVGEITRTLLADYDALVQRRDDRAAAARASAA